MEKIFSITNPEVLLHIFFKKEDFVEPRINLSPDEEYLQACSLVFERGRKIPSHKHLEVNKIGKITQEMIIVIEGELEVEYYDLNDQLIKKIILKEGDCSITYRGGHSFKALTENTKLYEIKNGPYQGRDKDKKEINHV
ncbi:cupin fold metalloprotein, WbuC family [Candidatus Pacearchaeota archaeon]|nr:cupin fold metalloprotein, WbuC family [Candidatus Pacearchaeota archaeon]